MPSRLIAPMLDAITATASAAAVFSASVLSSLLAGTPIVALTQVSPEAPMGTETAFLRWVIEQGGLVVALAVMFYMYRKDSREWQARLVELLKEREGFIKDQRDQADAYADRLEKNTVAITRLTTAIEDAQAERFPPRLSTSRPLS